MTKIEVFDLLGHAYFQQTEAFASGSHQIDLGNLPSGNYLARVRQGTNIQQTRFQVR